MKEVLKKYTFLVLLASENFLSPNVLKVYFFHASSVLHFAGNFENFLSLKFVKSSKSMLKVYFSEVLKKYTSQKHERSTVKPGLAVTSVKRSPAYNGQFLALPTLFTI